MTTTITVSDRVQASTPVFGLPVDEARVDPVVEATNRATTIREALMKGQIVDRNLTAPPGVAPADGTVYLVAAGGTGPWASKDGKLAIADNREPGGWVFVDLWAGATFWVVDEATALTWNGSAWVSDDGSSSLPLAGGTMSGSIAMGGNSLTGLAAGSAGTPAISPAEDATDGIYFSAGSVRVATSGAERLGVFDTYTNISSGTLRLSDAAFASRSAGTINYSTTTDHRIFAGGVEYLRVSAAGLGQLPAGSAAAPAISPAAYSTDGIWFTGSSVGFSVAGASGVRISANSLQMLARHVVRYSGNDILLAEHASWEAIRTYAGGTEVARFTSAGLRVEPGGVAASADASSALDLVSTAKGFLPPRMTTTQRDAISTPATGLVIYNTTDNVLNFYNGSTWGAV